MKLTGEQMDRLRMGALTAIDGLWFLAAERRLGFESALELDMEVWRGYGSVILKRVARAMGIEVDPDDPPDMETMCDMLLVLCGIDGTDCGYEKTGRDAAVLTVRRCPWHENLANAGRQDLVPCEEVDNNTFIHWLKAIDPSVSFELTHSLPRGDDRCEWILRRD